MGFELVIDRVVFVPGSGEQLLRFDSMACTANVVDLPLVLVNKSILLLVKTLLWTPIFRGDSA